MSSFGSCSVNVNSRVSVSSSCIATVFVGLPDVVVMFAASRSSSKKNNSTLKFLAVKFLFMTLTSMFIVSEGFQVQFVWLDCAGNVISIISSSSSLVVSSQNSYELMSGSRIKKMNIGIITSFFSIYSYGVLVI